MLNFILNIDVIILCVRRIIIEQNNYNQLNREK